MVIIMIVYMQQTNKKVCIFDVQESVQSGDRRGSGVRHCAAGGVDDQHRAELQGPGHRAHFRRPHCLRVHLQGTVQACMTATDEVNVPVTFWP